MNAASIAGLLAREGFRSCSPPIRLRNATARQEHWSLRFPKRIPQSRDHQCHRTAWAAWTIKTVSVETRRISGLSNSRNNNQQTAELAKGSAVLLLA